MSDQAQGPHWWQASDGRWYPPEQHPNAQPAAPPYTAPPTYQQPQSGWGQPTWQQQSVAPQPKRGGGTRVLVGVLLALVLMVGGCAGLAAVLGSSDEGEDVQGVPEPVPTAPADTLVESTPTTAPVTIPTAPTTAPPPPPQALMPDVVCMDLQSAQDAIQAAGVFFSRSFDATGQDRAQLVDSNWIVVSQDPPPGTPIGEAEANLGAVKIGEPSPC